MTPSVKNQSIGNKIPDKPSRDNHHAKRPFLVMILLGMFVIAGSMSAYVLTKKGDNSSTSYVCTEDSDWLALVAENIELDKVLDAERVKQELIPVINNSDHIQDINCVYPIFIQSVAERDIDKAEKYLQYYKNLSATQQLSELFATALNPEDAESYLEAYTGNVQNNNTNILQLDAEKAD